MNRLSRKAMVAAALVLSSTWASYAVACADPNLTKAITEAMGRPPKAGECNSKLYRKVDSHIERVNMVRETLTSVYSNGVTERATQKLPLRPVPEGKQPSPSTQTSTTQSSK